MESTIDLKKIMVFHLNDSQSVLGCRVDRHANIGKGALGAPVFEYLLNHQAFTRIPMILETPGGESCFRENLEILNTIRNKRPKAPA